MWESATDYEAVFHALPSAVALLNPQMVYADANEEYLRLSGRTRAQLIGLHLFDVFPDDGLVERRDEDIDAGLARLTDCLTRHPTADADSLADRLLSTLIPLGGNTDDTALVVIRL
ncbi:PAS domain-containing protein [Streptomyces sp. NPDC005279]|uniref:PAS domain-containing protein n=1 Tax=Streptomyces sp. NPDC005279 TaxID=3364712 RepID=UPI0036756DA6